MLIIIDVFYHAVGPQDLHQVLMTLIQGAVESRDPVVIFLLRYWFLLCRLFIMQASLGQWYFRRIAIPQLLPLYCLSNNRKKMVDLQLFRNQIYLQERASNLLCFAVFVSGSENFF